MKTITIKFRVCFCDKNGRIKKMLKLKQKMKTKLKHSFSLVEVLIVISIIFILAGIIFVSVFGHIANTRDAKRVLELGSLKSALENYFRDNGHYPVVTGSEDGICIEEGQGGTEFAQALQGYISILPKEPKYSSDDCNSGSSPKDKRCNSFVYRTEDEGKRFKIFAEMEKNTKRAENDGGIVNDKYEVYSKIVDSNKIPWIIWSSDFTDWQYRKPISIDNTSGSSLTDYQIKIELNSSIFEFDRADENGDDIRFSEDDKITEIPDYWIENWNKAGKTAALWVKVPNISAGLTQKIYMYYGNSLAIGVSSSHNTFILDSFTDTFFDETKINTGDSSNIAVSEDEAKISTQ